MKLICTVATFVQGQISARRGEVMDFPEPVALRLLDSFPGCWDRAPDAPAPVAEPPAKTDTAQVAPPANKMETRKRR